MRRGFDGLAALVPTQLEADPFSGQIFAFRGRRDDRLLSRTNEVLAKPLMRGVFMRPGMPCHGNVKGGQMKRQGQNIQTGSITLQQSSGECRYAVGIAQYEGYLVVARDGQHHVALMPRTFQRVVHTALELTLLGNHDVSKLAVLLEARVFRASGMSLALRQSKLVFEQ